MEEGKTLLQYTLVEKIGEGGMGVVWKARDADLGRDVAIKILPEGLAGDPERLARFEREARLLASLNHPHIAAVYDVGAEPGADDTSTHFIVQEYLEGESLRDLLDRGAPERW